MAWTTPRTWNPGEVVTAALLNEQLRDNLQTLYDDRNMGARVYRTSNQVVSSGANSPISFTAVRYDPQGLWSGATPSRLTVPQAGVYLMTGHIEFETVTATFRVDLRVNGVTVIASQQEPFANGPRLSLSTLYALNAGDYVELIVHHDAGSGVSVIASGNFSPELSVQWVGAV